MGIRDRELSERERIALGALLHDIGKVVQRASDNPSAKTHQEFGEKWIESHLPAPLGGELKFFSKYHHFNPESHPELDVSIP
ncbi:MAG: HD domain-containing protein [Candidatus Hydrothermia bacterium]